MTFLEFSKRNYIEDLGTKGLLISDMEFDSRFPKKAKKRSVIKTYLENQIADIEFIEAFEEIYTEYEKHNVVNSCC